MSVRIKQKSLSHIVLLIVAVVAVAAAVYFFLIRPSQTGEAVKLSSQQQELVDRFGYPNTFILTFGEMAVADEYKPVRFEAWNYDELGRRFYFVDGQFQRDVDIDFVENGQYPSLRPSQFPQNTSWKKVQEIIGTSPQTQAEIQPRLMEDTSVYDFWGQVKVAVNEDKVVYIQTYPVFSGAANESE